MSYQGLGILYSIPTTSTWDLFPDQTLTVDVPVQTISAHALAWAWPDILARLQQAMPQLIEQAMPQLIESAWPRIEPKVAPVAVTAWESIKPSLRAEIAAEEQKAAVMGTLIAAAMIGGGYALYRQFR